MAGETRLNWVSMLLGAFLWYDFSFFWIFQVSNFHEIFKVLGFGCLFAFVLAILEFLWNVKNVAIEEKVCLYYFQDPNKSLIPFQVTPMEALKSELKFALNLWITTKPVHKNLSEGSSRSRLHVDSETHSTKESLNSVKVDNENDKIGGKSKSLLNLNKVLDLARQKHSATWIWDGVMAISRTLDCPCVILACSLYISNQ